ncbi:MAG: homoserine dehydrogenase [Ruminococcaceae bacterium]|nr:homoserine dehydrogenase [Oscillospiraceae bacterium]
MIQTAIMGHGVVGSGVAEILLGHSKLINQKIKDDINVKYILDLRDFNDLPYSDKFIKDFNIIANDDEIKIVVEVMGGINPAYDFVKRLLLSGKSVVTSNKELVAAKGDELLKIASDNNANFLFEASVGGGIPIIRPIAQCLAANEITEIKGILNGTTNYILNKMIVDNMDFESALSLAQEMGFAEKDPTADIDGHDASRKICILASLAFGKHVCPDQVSTEGISNITLNDVEYADSFDCAIKLIGFAKKVKNGHITASVKPMLVSRSHILSDVNGVFNAIMVSGDSVGDVMFYGRGAGKLPTASAVVADVIDCAKHLHSRKYINWVEGSNDYVITTDEKVRLYVYIQSNEYNMLCEQFTTLFSDNTWHIKNDYKKEIAFITDKDYESVLMKKINSIKCDTFKVMHTLF